MTKKSQIFFSALFMLFVVLEIWAYTSSPVVFMMGLRAFFGVRS